MNATASAASPTLGVIGLGSMGLSAADCGALDALRASSGATW